MDNISTFILTEKELEHILHRLDPDDKIYIATYTLNGKGEEIDFKCESFVGDIIATELFKYQLKDFNVIVYFRTPLSFNRENEIIGMSHSYMGKINEDDKSEFLLTTFTLLSLDIFSLLKFVKNTTFGMSMNRLMIYNGYTGLAITNLEEIETQLKES